MINLIPNEEKKRMVKDFYFRLGVMFLFMLSTSLLVASVAILPSYFLSSLRRSVDSDKLATLKAEPEPEINPKIASIIKDLDTKLSVVEKAEKNQYLLSEKIVNEVVLKKMPDIRINEISYIVTGANKSVSIRGIAPSRERLLLFRRTLEEDPAFKKVDLPISNFIKGSDIVFSLNLVPA
jgi:hypothetical protein